MFLRARAAKVVVSAAVFAVALTASAGAWGLDEPTDAGSDRAAPRDAGAEEPTADAGSNAAPQGDAAAEPQTVVVTGTRGLAVGESAFATTKITPTDVREAPARTPDDVLRAAAEVDLPRANSDLEHPTAQSVSMRGVGSGRTLVLLDGVPLNDPFGGWIQWNRVPLSALDHVEIVRGAAANVYGNLGMGGVIQLFQEPSDANRLNTAAEYGTLDTYRAYAEGTRLVGDDVAVTLVGHAYRSAGAYVVPANERGPVDEPEPYESQNAAGRVDFRPSDRIRTFVSAGYFHERSNTGTMLSTNSVGEFDETLGLDFRPGAAALWRVRLFATELDYQNVNTNISSQRAVETIADEQDVPATRFGVSMVGSRRWSAAHALTVGVDAQRVGAVNHDLSFDARGAPVGPQTATGNQALLGAFAEWVFTPTGALTATAGARGDLWDNFGATNTPIGGETSSLPDRLEGAVSPRLAAVYRIARTLAVRGVAYSGFRAPTLASLYRSYEAYGITFLPNAELGGERLYGGEIGADWSPSPRLRASLTGYANELYDLIETVATAPTTSENENVGHARSAGLEADARWRIVSPLTLAASYALTDTRVLSSPAAPAAVGKELPSTAVHRGAISGRLRLADLFDATLRVWVESAAFADTLNTQKLPAFAQVDVTLSREIGGVVQIYVSARNLLDSEIVAYRTETLTTLGAPRTAWLGVRAAY